MKKEDLKFYLTFYGIVAFIVLIVSIIREVNYSHLIIKAVKEEYKAVVLEKFNPREWIKEPSHVKIKVDDYLEKDVDFAFETVVMDYISIGDSLIKIKDENICYVKKSTGEVRKFYYVKISHEDREHWTFPKEWKNKWMESSAWDTLQ